MAVYISEIRYDGGTQADFIEIAATSGTDLSGYSVVVYSQQGVVTETYSLGSIVTTIAGKDVYLIDSNRDPTFATLAPSNAIALVDDQGNVLQFISFEGNITNATEGPANGLTSVDIGNTSSSPESLETYDGGASYTAIENDNPGTIPCYAPGTTIDTPGGPRAVETLEAGDLVTTRDNGPKRILWTHAGTQPLEGVEASDKPVLVKAGAIGPNTPARDLVVSPQHRILVGGGQLGQIFAGESFAAAKSLTPLPGIRHMKGKRQITWVHFACQRHQIVFANGCWSESLLLGPMAIAGLSKDERAAVFAIYRTDKRSKHLNGPPARPLLRFGEVRRIIARHANSVQVAAE